MNNRIVLLLFFCVIMFLAFAPSPVYGTHNSTDFLATIVENAIAFHEEFYGVSYEGSVPGVRFATEEDELPKWSLAMYTGDKEIVYSTSYQGCGHVLNEVVDKSKSRSQCDLKEIRWVTSHELAHHLTHLYIERYVADSWIRRFLLQEEERGPEFYGSYMVIEGIGTYFGRIFGQKIAEMTEAEWEKQRTYQEFTLLQIADLFFYTGGYEIVKPIFEARGTHEGLIWLLRNALVIDLPNIQSALDYSKKGASRVPVQALEQD